MIVGLHVGSRRWLAFSFAACLVLLISLLQGCVATVYDRITEIQSPGKLNAVILGSYCNEEGNQPGPHYKDGFPVLDKFEQQLAETGKFNVTRNDGLSTYELSNGFVEKDFSLAGHIDYDKAEGVDYIFYIVGLVGPFGDADTVCARVIDVENRTEVERCSTKRYYYSGNDTHPSFRSAMDGRLKDALEVIEPDLKGRLQ